MYRLIQVGGWERSRVDALEGLSTQQLEYSCQCLHTGHSGIWSTRRYIICDMHWTGRCNGQVGERGRANARTGLSCARGVCSSLQTGQCAAWPGKSVKTETHLVQTDAKSGRLQMFRLNMLECISAQQLEESGAACRLVELMYGPE